MTTRSLLPVIAFFAMTTTVNAEPDFNLHDQFQKPHRGADIFAGKPVIIMAGMERKTPDAMEAWDDALQAEAPANVLVVGLSNLEGVPFFVPKSAIRKTLVKQLPNTVVLCDWKGKTYSRLGFPKGATIAVGVFGANGERLGTVSGPVNEARVAEVLALLPQ